MSDPLPERALARLLAAASDGGAATPAAVPARYQLRRELGRGGMGVVYEAFDAQLGRVCALKVIAPAGAGANEARLRFAREAQAAARLRHAHIAAVYDATPDYISMQLVAGGPIDAIPRTERRELVALVRDAALAVHHAHEQGIVHRDLKPSNLLVEDQGGARHVYVVDFGLAKEIALDQPLSFSGAVLGTPAFMPPEQAQGRNAAIDARSDVYALGATLHACLTGAPPFAETELLALLRQIVETEARAPGIERDLDVVIQKCLAKEPERRYPTALALADDLGRWLRHEPVHARPPSPGYRLRKLVQRRKALLKAAAVAVLLTAFVLVPVVLRERVARGAATEGIALAAYVTATLDDARTFTRLGDLPTAQRLLAQGVERARGFLARHELASVHHLLCRLLRAQGDAPAARAEIDRALALDPQFAEARFERGLILVQEHPLGDADRAQAIADLSVAVGPSSQWTIVDRLLGRGELLRLQGDLEQARELLEEVLVYDPMHVPARVSLARVALAAGDVERARQYSVSAVDLQLGFGPAYLAREGRLLPVSIAGLEGALVDFTHQLGEGPDNAVALAQRGLVHLRRALRLTADQLPADALAAVESAIDDHDAVLVIHQDLAGARNNRAVCHMEAERLHRRAGHAAEAAAARAQALADLQRAAAAGPTLPEPHFNQALLHLGAARLQRALGRAAAAARSLDIALQELRATLELAHATWPHTRTCRARLEEAETTRREFGQ